MRVVIAGAGVAGLEGALALFAHAGDLVDVELVSPTDEFVYRPLLVAEPFGAAEVLRFSLDSITGEAGARHTKDDVVSVDPGARRVTTGSGDSLEYDALLIALGAHPVESVPGSITFGGAAERNRFTELLGKLGQSGMKRLAFVVPPAASWSIAAYELALLTAAERDARGLHGVEITLVTHEAAALGLFGRAASQHVAALLQEAGIALRLSSRAERFENGALRLSGGESLEADAAVALPALEVQPLPGIPQRQNGFVQTDTAMHVTGLEAVWAAGDASWFPIKQGGLAAQQADIAARSIAAHAGAHVPTRTFQPVLRGALITGGAPEFLRASRADPDADAAVRGRALWWPPTKLAGAFLGPFIARATGDEGAQEQLVDLEPPAEPLEDEAEHDRAVALVLAAADADAGAGDFEGALKWLSFAEELNLVISPEYVARRHEWRRQVQPDVDPDAAAIRIDPSFASAADALADLQRRINWLREIEHQREGEVGDQLTPLLDEMDYLLARFRRAKSLEAGRV